MVMSMYTLLRNDPQPTEEEMEANLRGTSIIIIMSLRWRMHYLLNIFIFLFIIHTFALSSVMLMSLHELGVFRYTDLSLLQITEWQ